MLTELPPGRANGVVCATPCHSVRPVFYGQCASLGVGFAGSRQQEYCVVYAFLEGPGGFGSGVLFYICHVARVLPEVGQLYRYALDMRG